jgi:hypothetical protein
MVSSSTKDTPPTSSAAATATATASTSSQSKSQPQQDQSTTTGGIISLEEQLNKALTSLETNRQSTAKLFMEWRSQLWRLSLMVLVLVLAMAQKPSTACLNTIKSYNNNKNIEGDQAGDLVDVEHDKTISFVDAMKYVVEDSAMELLSVICCMFLVWMLHDDGSSRSSDNAAKAVDDFASTSYRCACALLPGIITLYYQNRNKPLGKCLPDGMMMMDVVVEEDPKEEETDGSSAVPAHAVEKHGFPLILVFHLITSLALWFMKYQMKQHQNSIDKVLKLQDELVGSGSGKETGTRKKNGKAGSAITTTKGRQNSKKKR